MPTYDLKLLDTYDDMSTFCDGLVMKIKAFCKLFPYFCLDNILCQALPCPSPHLKRLPTIIITNTSQCAATHYALGSTLNVDAVFIIF